MKRGLVVSMVLIFVLCATGAFAGQPIGGPAGPDPGKLAFSVGYFYSKDKWESNTLNGDFKLETNTYFGQVAYGLAPGWDVYLRGGAITAKNTGDEFDWKENSGYFGGIGMHGKFYEKKDWNLILGPTANFTYFSNWKDSITTTGVIGNRPMSGRTEVEMKEHYSFDVGLGFQWAPVPYLRFYGGPFYHYETARLDVDFVAGLDAFSDGSNIHPSKTFGTRFGVRIPFTDQIALQLEGQYRDYFSGGAAIGFSF
jgi:hypothetical protein